mmetsp:Transcript_105286/g.302784  ORF Transcript_105286/g.302784 Transcript_105286/m.302784 type:complete len:343 (+) Transcript_105286:346-1374(+)
MRALGSHGRVLRSVLGAGEAHIENAPVLRAVLVVRVRIRGLAGPQGHVVFRRIVLLALLDVMPRARPDGRHVVEEALVAGDNHPGLVIGGIVIKVAAVAILTAHAGRHRDPHIDVVRPTHHLHLRVQRQVHVNDVFLKVGLRGIDDDALVIVAERRDTGHTHGAEPAQHRLPVDEDLAVVHGAHHDRVAQQEGAADGDGMCGRKSVRVRSRKIPALDPDHLGLHDPELALGEVVHESMIKGLDMGISPDAAGARRADRGGGCRLGRRNEEDDDNDDDHNEQHKAQDGEAREARLRGDVVELAGAKPDVFVGRLRRVRAHADADEAHAAAPAAAAAASQRGGG